MEMRNNAADIKRSIKIGEETKTAAREATERSKMVVGVVKELKDKAPPVRTQGHMSYAAVAANGVLASGTPSSHGVKAVSLQAQGDVSLSIRNALTTSKLRAMKLRDLKSDIERALD